MPEEQKPLTYRIVELVAVDEGLSRTVSDIQAGSIIDTLLRNWGPKLLPTRAAPFILTEDQLVEQARKLALIAGTMALDIDDQAGRTGTEISPAIARERLRIELRDSGGRILATSYADGRYIVLGVTRVQQKPGG